MSGLNLHASSRPEVLQKAWQDSLSKAEGIVMHFRIGDTPNVKLDELRQNFQFMASLAALCGDDAALEHSHQLGIISCLLIRGITTPQKKLADLMLRSLQDISIMLAPNPQPPDFHPAATCAAMRKTIRRGLETRGKPGLATKLVLKEDSCPEISIDRLCLDSLQEDSRLYLLKIHPDPAKPADILKLIKDLLSIGQILATVRPESEKMAACLLLASNCLPGRITSRLGLAGDGIRQVDRGRFGLDQEDPPQANRQSLAFSNQVDYIHNDSELKEYLSFHTGGEYYAVDIIQAREIIPVPAISRLPGVPGHVLGLMNLRGQVVPVIDLRLKLGLSPRNPGEEVALVVKIGAKTTAIIVDGVDDVLQLDPVSIKPAPQPAGKDKKEYIWGLSRLHGKLFIFINLDELFSTEVNQDDARS